MLIPRKLTEHLKRLVGFFPVISLTGPRQAGKTTLLQFLFPEYEYVSLENPDLRLFAEEDPRSFLERYSGKVIFDEAQRVPKLFSYIQGIVDVKNEPGQFILSGSQNFLLHKHISQSLAGRVGILRLFPFSCQELDAANMLDKSMEETLFKGFYPRIFDQHIPPTLFYPNYIETYLQRDVKDQINVQNLSTFQQFLQLCAGHIGQLVNYSQLANAMGINIATVKSWLSILEQSYTVFRVSPYHSNFNKRIVKSSKLYFYDTGLACNLLRMKRSQEVISYYQRGALFENLVIADLVKQLHSQGERADLYFWRDNHGNEIDILQDMGSSLKLIEIKATRTLGQKHFRNIRKFQRWLSEKNTEFFLVHGGDDRPYQRNEVQVLSWRNLDLFIE